MKPELPSDDELERFAPEADSRAATFRAELERKRTWLRGLRGLPAWKTKEETQKDESSPVVPERLEG